MGEGYTPLLIFPRFLMMDVFSFLFYLLPWTLLLLRIVLGAIFIVHGPPKLKKAHQLGPAIGMSPGLMWTVGLLETLAAISMLLGVFTQIGALVIVVLMVGALYYKVLKWKMPFTAMDKTGWEFDLLIIGSALVLASMGGGPLSIDWMLLSL